MSRIRTTKQARDCREAAVRRIRLRPVPDMQFERERWIGERVPGGYVCANCGEHVIATPQSAQTMRGLSRDHKKVCEQ
jgi:hypothetical protein